MVSFRPATTHLILVGRVLRLGQGPVERPPLLFHQGRYATLADATSPA